MNDVRFSKSWKIEKLKKSPHRVGGWEGGLPPLGLGGALSFVIYHLGHRPGC